MADTTMIMHMSGAARLAIAQRLLTNSAAREIYFAATICTQFNIKVRVPAAHSCIAGDSGSTKSSPQLPDFASRQLIIRLVHALVHVNAHSPAGISEVL
jgi:hypothetical protein